MVAKKVSYNMIIMLCLLLHSSDLVVLEFFVMRMLMVKMVLVVWQNHGVGFLVGSGNVSVRFYHVLFMLGFLRFSLVLVWLMSIMSFSLVFYCFP